MEILKFEDVTFVLDDKRVENPLVQTVSDSEVAKIAAMSTAEKGKAFIAEIRAMNKRMEIPTGFDFIKEEDIPGLAKIAEKEGNPR